MILDVKDLQVAFTVGKKQFSVIRGVSLRVYRGRTLALVGESGSGKSVLTKSFTGMLEENAQVRKGEILLHQGDRIIDLAQIKKPRQWQDIRGGVIASVFQDPMTALNPLQSVGKQIAQVIRLHQGVSAQEAKKRAVEMLELVGIPQGKQRYGDYPFRFSGGQRQRIVIAIALSCRPQLLICDEPTTALDVTVQAQILQLLKDLQKKWGFGMVFITHDLGVVANIATDVAVLYAGQVVETGTVEDIFYDPRHPYTWALLQSLPQLAEVGKPLFSIGGAPPAPDHLPEGDAFAPRNPYRLAIDLIQPPKEISLSETHRVRSWLADPRAPKILPPEAVRNLHENMKARFG